MNPSPAPRERAAEARRPRAGEGISAVQTLTLPSLRDGSLPLPHCGRGVLLRGGGFGAAGAGVGVLLGREAAVADVLCIFMGGGADLVAELAVAPDEFRGELGE